MNNPLLSALNVRVLGNGPRVVVLTQTAGTDQSVWRGVVPRLVTARYRVFLYDLVCSGAVRPALYDRERYASLDAYVDDLFQILDRYGVRRCAFVGHSFSCMIGILAAIRRPQLIAKLILIGASPRFVDMPAINCYGGFTQEDVGVLANALERNYDDFVNGRPAMVVADDLPLAVREFSRTLFNMLPSISRDVFQTMFNADLRGILGSVTAHCVLVQATGITCTRTPASEYLVAHLGGRTDVRFLRICSNIPQLRTPGVVATMLLGVLRGAFEVRYI